MTAYAPGLGIGEPIDRADGWNLVAGVSLHRPRSVPPYVPDKTARFLRGGRILGTSHQTSRGGIMLVVEKDAPLQLKREEGAAE